MATEWDVIIIGGGPAGSSAAITLAQQGRRVLLLEKETFPRFHIGESLLPYNRRLFAELGVDGEIKSAGFMVKRGAQFWLGDGSRRVRVCFAKGTYTDEPESVQVERSIFDHILLKQARKTGAEVREGCIVTGCKIDEAKATVQVRQSDGTASEHTAAFVLDASGLSNLTGNLEGLREFYPGHKKVAIFGHFKDVLMSQASEEGDILIVRRRQSWCWLIPLSGGKTSVGIVFDASEVKSSDKTPAELFADAVATTPELSRRMANTELLSPIHTVRDFSYTNRRLVSPRLIRLGDAAGFIDPVFSSGVFLAMKSGIEGAKTAHEAIEKGSAMTPAMRRYESENRRCIKLYWRFIEKFYTEEFVQVLVQPNRRFDLPSAVNCVLAGRTELPWSVRWRLELFFAIVKLQKWVPVVQRVFRDAPDKVVLPLEPEPPVETAQKAIV
jgi:flavin-dependent dehydrogenase